MRYLGSLLLIVGGAPSLCARIAGVLAPYGWTCRADDGGAMQDAATLIIAGDSQFAANAVAAVRQLPQPGNGTPILMIGNDAVSLAGAGCHLPPIFTDDELLRALEQWAGPLGDHALREDPLGPRYRLIRLVGLDNANAMFGRFAAALEEALATARDDPAAVPAHRLAGIAGMLGHGELHTLWSRVDTGEAGALEPALAASRKALSALG